MVFFAKRLLAAENLSFQERLFDEKLILEKQISEYKRLEDELNLIKEFIDALSSDPKVSI